MRRTLLLGTVLLAAAVLFGCEQRRRTDPEITAEIRQDLRDAAVPGMIAVEVNRGIVALSGTVPTENARGRAEDVAEDVSGVASVTNNLRVATGDAPAGAIPPRPMAPAPGAAPGGIPPAAPPAQPDVAP